MSIERRHCFTQRDEVAGDPLNHKSIAEDKSDKTDSGFKWQPRIYVGIQKDGRRIIPRWHASQGTPTRLAYFVVKNSFEKEELATYTANCFQAAADEWNALNFGLIITPTWSREHANFLVEYADHPRGFPKLKNVVASAFFPNEVDSLYVYKIALTNSFQREHLKNTFLHEIGHVIGLRHEFANDMDPENPGHAMEEYADLIGEPDEHSVMTYEDVNNITGLDIAGVRTFYGLENGSEYSRLKVPVIDFKPTPLPLGRKKLQMSPVQQGRWSES